MRDELSATITSYLLTLEEDGIGPTERLSVGCVLADLLTLAGIPADDWPIDVALAVDAVAPVPA